MFPYWTFVLNFFLFVVLVWNVLKRVRRITLVRRLLRTKTAPWKERLAYFIDQTFSMYPEFKIYSLLAFTATVIFIGGPLFYVVVHFPLFWGDEEGEFQEQFSFLGSFWKSWTFIVDGGAHVDEETILARAVSLLLTITGMLINAVLVGLVADWIGDWMDDLRKGRCAVIEKNHSVILGWTEKTLPLIYQFALANESQGGGVVAVLSPLPKEEMENAFFHFSTELDLRGTDVVFRSGSPLDVGDLLSVSAQTARSIIVLAEPGNPEDADATLVRTVLALSYGVENCNATIVTEVRDIDNRELIELSGRNIQTFVSQDVIGRLMLQCSIQKGLAQVYERLLGFEGHEFYLKEWPSLVGRTFDEVSRMFEDAVPIGVKQTTATGKRKMILNPPRDLRVREGDEILVIAEDDDTYQPLEAPRARSSKARLSEYIPINAKEKLLFVGWRRDLDDMITELDQLVAPGSELHILARVPVKDRDKLLKEGGLSNIKNLILKHHAGNQVARKDLEKLPLEEFNSILILADEAEEGVGDLIKADSRSLASLLLIRDIQKQRNQSNCSILSEIIDPRTKKLITVKEETDYVVSNEIVSMVLAMIAERSELSEVFDELFTAEGQELHLRSSDIYLINPNELLNFWDLQQRATQRNEILLGYRTPEGSVVLNPSDKDDKQKWNKYVFVALSEQ